MERFENLGKKQKKSGEGKKVSPLVIFAQRGEKNDCRDIGEQRKPFAALRALAADVDDSKGVGAN